MKKTYIIIAAVLIALWAGFMVFRHMKQKESQQAHHEQTYNRMVAAAKKSPRAGLAQMGRALNRYFQDNKIYPGSLDDLYPKYIASRAFISQIDWDYGPGQGDFLLSKRIVYNNREMVASIDRSIRPEIKTGVAVARRSLPVRRKVPAPVEVETAPEVEALAVAELEIVDEVKMTRLETDVVAAAAGSVLAAPASFTSKVMNVQREVARVVALVGPEIVSTEKTEFVSRSLERYLVWKDSSGFIGVSNVQYPEMENMYVAVHDTWYNVKRRGPQIPVARVSGRTQTAPEEKRAAGQMALDLSKQYLVWKDENGVIGVGNIQYPDTGQLTIASQDAWGPLEREPLPPTATAEDAEIKKEPMDADQLAASLSSNYLVWKDENGVIGIGNVQYPDRQRLKIAALDKWETIKQEPLAPVDITGALPITQQLRDDKVAVAGIGRNYLVWKDKNGVIGFGNVQYPEMKNVSYVHADQSWKKVAD